jgi:hypothetical protein
MQNVFLIILSMCCFIIIANLFVIHFNPIRLNFFSSQQIQCCTCAYMFIETLRYQMIYTINRDLAIRLDENSRFGIVYNCIQFYTRARTIYKDYFWKVLYLCFIHMDIVLFARIRRKETTTYYRYIEFSASGVSLCAERGG